MIFKGRVTMSLKEKDENEFFNFYPTNYFGDYQILLGLKSSESYKASAHGTYCHCIKKKRLLDLMSSFPNSHLIFKERAVQRRTEFRRVRKQYEKFADVNPDSVLDRKNIENKNRF